MQGGMLIVEGVSGREQDLNIETSLRTRRTDGDQFLDVGGRIALQASRILFAEACCAAE
jgi:hypothetical protein